MKTYLSFAQTEEMGAHAGNIPERPLVELDWSERAARADGLRSDTEIEIWRVDLDAVTGDVAARLGAMLSADEWERADQFRFSVDRRRFVAGRGALRCILSHHLGVSPAAVVFEYGPAGKPRLMWCRDGVDEGLHFNVSHSGGLALIAVTRVGEIGIDVEPVRDLPDWEGVAELAFEPGRIAALRAQTGADRREAFFREWTRQEAIAKAHGTGLGAAQRAEAFAVSTFSFSPGWVVSLAAPPAADGLRCRSWCADSGALASLFNFHTAGALVAADSAVSL